MSSAASDAALIAVDWGTSSFRACLLSPSGEVLDQIEAPDGILSVGEEGFEATLLRHIGPWRAPARPIAISGMITSRNGWVETPYVDLPAGRRELAGALTLHQLADGGEVHFVTGVMQRDGDRFDIIRGEECQVVGALLGGAADGLFVLPGTHSKWVAVEDGRIARFSTYMTGELFAALRGHTILGRLMTPGPFARDAFLAGAAAGRETGGALLRELFQLRTRTLFGRLAAEDGADYLSGLLIGHEIADALRHRDGGGAVTIVGRSDLAERYETALREAGCEVRRTGPNLAALGVFAIAQSAGLIP